MKSKRIIAITMLAICLCSSVPSYADINEDVKKAQIEYQVYEDRIAQVSKEVYSLNHTIEALVATMQENETKVLETENQIKANETFVEKLKLDIVEKEKLKDSRVREMYKTNPTANYISLILDSKSLSELISVMEGFSKIMDLDKEIISGLEEDKNELNEKVMELNNKNRELVVYRQQLKSSKESLDLKKAEQEQIISVLEKEKAVFSSEVLEVAERQLVSYQLDTIASSNNKDELSSMVSQLNAIVSNQLSAPSIIAEANEAIAMGNSKIESIKQQEQAQVNSGSGYIPNRGVADATGNAIVDYAYQFLGKSYVWGAVGPDVFDCSGLTSYVYRHAAGMEISRTTYTQINVGVAVSYDDLQPGDLVFTYENEHVGIYVGGGMYINATYPGSTVRVTPVTNFYAARRYL